MYKWNIARADKVGLHASDQLEEREDALLICSSFLVVWSAEMQTVLVLKDSSRKLIGKGAKRMAIAAIVTLLILIKVKRIQGLEEAYAFDPGFS